MLFLVVLVTFTGSTNRVSPTPVLHTSTAARGPGLLTFPPYGPTDLPVVDLPSQNAVDDCGTSGCPDPHVCNEKIGRCVCPNFCKGTFPQMDIICGTDCRHYFNMCHFQNEQCKASPDDLAVFKRGFCPPRRDPTVRVSAGDDSGSAADDSGSAGDDSGTDTVSASRASSVSLTCHVTSSQTHVITWQHTDHNGNPGSYRRSRGSRVVTNTVIADTVRSVSVLELSAVNLSHSGVYTCVATLCGARRTHSITLDVTEYPICTLLSAGFLSTFDGLTYQTTFDGDFILAMDEEDYRWFIYGRFQRCEEGSAGGGDYCLSSVTVHDTESVLSMYRGHMLHGRNIWRELDQGEVVSRDHKTVYVRGEMTVMSLYGGDAVITWDNKMSLYITVVKRVRTGGLCGNNDRNPGNDFRPRYTVSPTLDTFTNYLFSWRISNAEEPLYNTAVDTATHVPDHGQLASCQSLLILRTADCVPLDGKLELLRRVCVYELTLNKTFKDRETCGVECYISLQVQTMCDSHNLILSGL